MPIGKNSLKRVSNNGYSAVKSAAPDMENSEIVTPVAEPKAAEAKPAAKAKVKPEKAEAKPEKAAPVSNKKAPAPKKATKKRSTAKTATPPIKKSEDAAAKPAARRGRPPKKKPTDTIPTAAETAAVIAGAGAKGKGYYNIGDDMPIYLL